MRGAIAKCQPKQELSQDPTRGPGTERGCVPGAQPEPSRPPTGELHNRAGSEDGAPQPGGPPQPGTAVAPGEQPRLRRDRLDSRAFGFRRWRSHNPKKQTP